MAGLSIGKAWDEAKTALAANRRLVVPVALGLILLPAVVAAMIQPPAGASGQAEPGLWMIGALAMFLVMFVGQMALILIFTGWNRSVGEAIAQAARRLPTMLLISIIIFVPALLIVSVILAVTALGTGGPGQFDLANLSPAGSLALLVCILLLFYLSVRLVTTVAVVAVEELGAIQSLRRSWQLTAGHFWRLFAFLFLMLVAFGIAALTVGAVVGSLVTLALGQPEPWSVAQLIYALTGGLVQAAFVLVYTAMLARIYVQLGAAPRASVPTSD